MRAARRELAAWHALDRRQRPEEIRRKRDAVVHHHLENTPAFARKVEGRNAANWNELPVLSKHDLQAPLPEILSRSFRPNEVYVSNTSGSSGHPFFFAKDKFCHAMTWAFIQDRYASWGITGRSKQARFYGIPKEWRGYWSEKLKDAIMGRTRFPVFDMGTRQLELFLDRFRHDRFHYVYGYTNSILLFAGFLRDRVVVLKEVCPSLTCCIVTSEVCREEDKQFLEQWLGVPVIREYGASELDVIAMEDNRGRWAINECNLYVEVLSEDDQVLPHGQEGRIVVTSMYNKAFPMVRYDLGDVGVLEEDAEGLVLKTLSGRVNDTIQLPSGKKSPGLTFYYVSRSILESSGVLKEFIVRQTALNAFEFDVVSDRPLTDQETATIREKMDHYLEPGLLLKINRVERIARPASGKIKHFYSEIS